MANDQAPISKSQISTKHQMPSSKRQFDLEDRTLAFARRVIDLCRRCRQDIVTREVISQLVRSGGSVGANYREANEALSRKDFSHRIRIARKEAKETEYWLQLLGQADSSLNGDIETLRREAQELRKILSVIAEKSS